MKFQHLFALTLLTTVSFVAPTRAENLEHVQQLTTTRQCQGCDLVGSSLVFANLQGADLSGANLTGANLNRANLMGANLSGANLTGAILFNVNLTGANLSGANLTGADLRESYLTGATLDGANLMGANTLGTVGLPDTIATPEQIYLWGLEEYQRENFRGAITYYNQALSQKPDFAHAILARGMARFRMHDLNGALQDARRAESLYMAQGNGEGHQASIQFAAGLEAVQASIEQGDRAAAGRGGGNILNLLGSLTGLLFRLF